VAGYMIHLEWRPYTAADGTDPKTPPVRPRVLSRQFHSEVCG